MTGTTSQALLVLTTCASVEEGRRLSAEAVERQLAACVNMIGDIASTYRWQGKVEHAQESLLLMKTTEDRFAALRDLIRERSTYELPEVLAVRVADGSAAYLDWLRECVDAR